MKLLKYLCCDCHHRQPQCLLPHCDSHCGKETCWIFGYMTEWELKTKSNDRWSSRAATDWTRNKEPGEWKSVARIHRKLKRESLLPMNGQRPNYTVSSRVHSSVGSCSGTSDLHISTQIFLRATLKAIFTNCSSMKAQFSQSSFKHCHMFKKSWFTKLDSKM